MKQATHTLSKSAMAMLLAFAASHGLADTASDTELLLNWAEKTYPEIFSVKKTTQTSGPWIYRNYSEKGILAGVNKDDMKVYVMGGPWGNSPVVIDSLANLMKVVNGNTGGTGGSFKACDQTEVPQGMNVSQNGNVVTVTTNGCIPVPTQADYCDGVAENYTPTATNIHIYTTVNIQSFSLKGISAPSFQSIIDTALGGAAPSSSCLIHAPQELKDNLYTVNMDVCYDMTSAFKDFPNVPGLVTVTPPITYSLKATSTMQQVSDCFTSGAQTVWNTVTKEAWIKEGSGYKKLPTAP